ncbi:MAG: hypothetical protein H6710_19100 [Myxococcales bacterium]|nr:hypothetical protein [Myxococcales bacterium]
MEGERDQLLPEIWICPEKRSGRWAIIIRLPAIPRPRRIFAAETRIPSSAGLAAARRRSGAGAAPIE